MLSFELIYSDESRESLQNVLSAQLDCQLDVPADSLTLTLPFVAKYRDALFAAVWEGDVLRFYGPVDESLTVRQSGKLIVRLFARSLAAFLLDNEAEPLTYENPSNRMIAERHLLPFGITDYDNERYPLYDSLQIEKGMSHWQVLERFCHKRYGCVPRIAGKKAYLKGVPLGDTVLLGEKGTPFFSLRECRRPCRLISEIRVRLNPNGGYASVIRNPHPDCANRHRVRYLNVTADNVSLDTASQMIEKGNRESYEIQLVCRGMRADLLGMAAVVEDSGIGKIEGLRVAGVKCQQNDQGETSTIHLRKEQF